MQIAKILLSPSPRQKKSPLCSDFKGKRFCPRVQELKLLRELTLFREVLSPLGEIAREWRSVQPVPHRRADCSGVRMNLVSCPGGTKVAAILNAWSDSLPRKEYIL
jgi:hypothetical protein